MRGTKHVLPAIHKPLHLVFVSMGSAIDGARGAAHAPLTSRQRRGDQRCRVYLAQAGSMKIYPDMLAVLKQRHSQNVLSYALTCMQHATKLCTTVMLLHATTSSSNHACLLAECNERWIALSRCMSASESSRKRCLTAFLCACFAAADDIAVLEPD